MIYKVKRKYYKNLVDDKIPEAIFILGSGDSINHGIKKRTLKGLIALFYKGRNPHLIGGGEARLYAALELSNYFLESKIVAMSHKVRNTLSGNAFFSLTKKTAQQLYKKGLQTERVIHCERSTSTLTEIMEVVKLTMAKKWKTVVIITNEYHISRAKLLFYLLTNPSKQGFLFKSCYKSLKKVEDQELFKKEWETFLHAVAWFHSNNSKVLFIAAEEILPEKYVFYERVIDAVYTTEAYKNREALEEKGVQMILQGTYNFDENHTIESYLHYGQ